MADGYLEKHHEDKLIQKDSIIKENIKENTYDRGKNKKLN